MAGSTQGSGNAAGQSIEAEFQELYRAPGARNLAVIGLFGGLGPLTFYLIDAVSTDQPWIGGAQSLRLALVVVYLSLSVLCWTKPGFATRNYPWLFSTVCIVFMVVACMATYSRHKDESLAEILRGFDTTLILSTVVVAKWLTRPTGVATA